MSFAKRVKEEDARLVPLSSAQNAKVRELKSIFDQLGVAWCSRCSPRVLNARVKVGESTRKIAARLARARKLSWNKRYCMP